MKASEMIAHQYPSNAGQLVTKLLRLAELSNEAEPYVYVVGALLGFLEELEEAGIIKHELPAVLDILDADIRQIN